MATVTTALKAVHGYGNPGRKPFFIENEIDFADHTVDPSAGDVVQALTIPAGTMIMAAGMEVVTAPTLDNDSDDDVVATLGTDTDADKYVAAFDFDAASAGDYAPAVTGTGGAEVHGTANTLDITFSATSADGISAGKIRVWAVLMDIEGLGSDKSANEADRDVLA